MDSERSLAVSTLRGMSVLSVLQFERRELDELFAIADTLRVLRRESVAAPPLAGKIMITAFFEPSTRTRLAHESAMIRSGGSVAGFSDASSTRAGGKFGESAEDAIRMLDLYGDVIVLRHPEDGVVAKAVATLQNAIAINAGDGTGEHPTQALADMYSIWRRFGRIDGIRVGITNDIRMRCVRSLIRLCRLYDCDISIVGAPNKGLDGDLLAECRAHGQPVEVLDDLREMLPKVDVVYSSPTILKAVDPTLADSQPAVIAGDTPLDCDLVTRWCQPHAVVMHPLPRGGELCTDLDDTAFNGYWEQAGNGIPIRMALLRSLLT